MMHDKKTWRVWLTASLLGAVLLMSGLAVTAVAQDEQTQPKATTTKKVVSSGRDPFKKYEPPRAVIKQTAGQASVPSIQDRINRYKAQKAAAMSARMPAPKPTTALSLSEIQVIGISRTPRGYAAIIEATPIKLSYVIYPGEPFYDGQLVSRHEIVFTDGRRERSVQLKTLRQSNVNAMSAAGATASVAKP